MAAVEGLNGSQRVKDMQEVSSVVSTAIYNVPNCATRLRPNYCACNMGTYITRSNW